MHVTLDRLCQDINATYQHVTGIPRADVSTHPLIPPQRLPIPTLHAQPD